MPDDNHSQEPASSVPSDGGSSDADSQSSGTSAVKAPRETDIKIVFPSKDFTYRYSHRTRSRFLLAACSALACLILVALPAVIATAIGGYSPIVRLLSFIPILIGIPYSSFVIYRLFIQGSGESNEPDESQKVDLILNLKGEGRGLAGWAGSLAVIGTVISVLIEFLH
jgi:hypothetical protein